jgi:hypothetical protein
VRGSDGLGRFNGAFQGAGVHGGDGLIG